MDAGPSRVIDLSVDVGESEEHSDVERDHVLIASASTAHVAAGGHAGSPETMAAAVEACLAAGTRLGAHPSYPDRQGFGRRRFFLKAAEVVGAVLDQITVLDGVARAAGARVESIKPHGQLYHDLDDDPELAEAVVAAVSEAFPHALFVLAAGSRVREVAERHGVHLIAEGFCDRRYLPSGRIAPRNEEGALLLDPTHVASQAVEIATHGLVVDGLTREVTSLCVHSDSPGASVSIEYVRAALSTAGISISAPRA